ncbi:LD-carboxypeptidase [Lewinellaceae bacterium SD302]|nr:LD-carboxypeptidase [Lewinellaceae bacterium SD302]
MTEPTLKKVHSSSRRHHLKKLFMLGLPTLLGCGAANVSARPDAGKNSGFSTSIATLKPKKLQPGDKIRLVAPGGPVTEAKIKDSYTNLEKLGLVITEGANIREKRGQHAGTDAQRLADLHAAFADQEVKAIWAIRGGDGGSRLLAQLDYELIRKNPKILIGFSDITALLQAIRVKTGLVGFHGPVAYWPLDAMNLPSLRTTLFEPPQTKGFRYPPGLATKILVAGRSSGPLAGGNLSILTALAGTEYALDCRDKLIFIEDVGEAPRRIDRMLTTLLDATGGRSLRNAKGIILGEFLDCDCERNPADPENCAGNSMTLPQVLADRLAGLGIPVVTDFPFGHDANMITFPVGVSATLDAGAMTVTLEEAATLV